VKRTQGFGVAIAVLAFLATFGGSSASASMFTMESELSKLSGTTVTENQFNLSGTAFNCPGMGFEGGVAKKTAQTFTPEYVENGSCSISKSPHTMKMNGCKLILHPGKESGGVFPGTFDIGPAGCGPVTMTGEYCPELVIPSQSGLAATFKNEGSGATAIVRVSAEVSTLKYIGGGGACGTKGKSYENGGWHVSWQVKATNPVTTKQVGVRVSPLGVYMASGKFDAETFPVAMSGNIVGEHVFGTAVGNTACSKAQIGAVASGSTADLPVDVAYDNACPVLGLGGTIDMNSCHYLLHSTNPEPPYGGSAEIACNAEGDVVEMTASWFGWPICTVSYPAQSIGSATYKTQGEGTGRSVLAEVAGEGIEYSVSGIASSCSEKAGVHNDGTFKGKIALHE
jgi:hypothetical protein